MKIVQYPHPALRFSARPLTAINERVRTQARQMLDLMYEAKGLGLASNQVGLPYQLIVINSTADPSNPQEEQIFINPVIIERKGAQEGEEGCLSFPDVFAKVRRAKTVTTKAYNLKGELVEVTCSDLKARLVQHEVDHLHGVLYIDKMGPIARLAVRSSLKELERKYKRAQEKGEIPPDAEIEKTLKALEAEA
jgi:peptide deformylase